MSENDHVQMTKRKDTATFPDEYSTNLAFLFFTLNENRGFLKRSRIHIHQIDLMQSSAVTDPSHIYLRICLIINHALK